MFILRLSRNDRVRADTKGQGIVILSFHNLQKQRHHFCDEHIWSRNCRVLKSGSEIVHFRRKILNEPECLYWDRLNEISTFQTKAVSSNQLNQVANGLTNITAGLKHMSAVM